MRCQPVKLNLIEILEKTKMSCTAHRVGTQLVFLMDKQKRCFQGSNPDRQHDRLQHSIEIVFYQQRNLFNCCVCYRHSLCCYSIAWDEALWKRLPVWSYINVHRYSPYSSLCLNDVQVQACLSARVCYSLRMFLTEMQALEWGQPLFLKGGWCWWPL